LQAKILEFVEEHPKYALALGGPDAEPNRAPRASGACAQVHLRGQYALKIVHPNVDEDLVRWRRPLPLATSLVCAAGFSSLVSTLDLSLRAIEAQRDMRDEFDGASRYYFRDLPAAQLGPQFRTPRPYAATRDLLLLEAVPAKNMSDWERELGAAAFAALRRHVFMAVSPLVQGNAGGDSGAVL
jgi:predicted unusual protein kinase regulating ubiquinone biosynthesis (AarF/ABC1/UbiB family)